MGCIKTCLIPICPCLVCCGDDDDSKKSSETEPVASSGGGGGGDGGCCCGDDQPQQQDDGCCCGPDQPQQQDDDCCCGPDHPQQQQDDDCCCCGPDAPPQQAPRAAAPMDAVASSSPAPAPAPMDAAVSSSPAAAAVASVAPVPVGPMGGNKSGSNSPKDGDDKEEGSSGPTGIMVVDTGIENRDKRPSGDDKKELVEFVTPEDGYGCNECGSTFPKGTTMWSNRDENIDICPSCHKD